MNTNIIKICKTFFCESNCRYYIMSYALINKYGKDIDYDLHLN